jgi:signal transduction histidine kinase
LLGDFEMKQQKLQNNSKSQFDHANKKAANFARKIPALEPIEKKESKVDEYKILQEQSCAHNMKNLIFTLDLLSQEWAGMLNPSLVECIRKSRTKFASLFDQFRQIAKLDGQKQMRKAAWKAFSKYLNSEIKFCFNELALELEEIAKSQNQELAEAAKEQGKILLNVKNEFDKNLKEFIKLWADWHTQEAKSEIFSLNMLLYEVLMRIEYTEKDGGQRKLGLLKQGSGIESLNINIKGDPKLAECALENVLRNAKQHVLYRGGSLIGVDVEIALGKAWVIVYNDGPVMSEEIKERLFLAEGVKDPIKPSSSGFGLPHSKWCMQMQGGSISVLKEGEQLPFQIKGILGLGKEAWEFLETPYIPKASKLTVMVLSFPLAE